MPLLSQHWPSSQARLARYQSQICSHLFELLEHNNKRAAIIKLLDVICLDDQKGFEKLQLQKVIDEKEQMTCETK